MSYHIFRHAAIDALRPYVAADRFRLGHQRHHGGNRHRQHHQLLHLEVPFKVGFLPFSNLTSRSPIGRPYRGLCDEAAMTLQIPNHSGTHIRTSFNLQTLRDKMRMSIPHSPTGFKREMLFLEIVRGVVRVMLAVMRRQDGGSPCGGRGATAFCWVLCAVRQ